MNKATSFIAITTDGKEVECNVICDIYSEQTNKNYIIYTDYMLDNEEEIKVYASSYEKKGDRLELQEIKTDLEWNLVEAMLDEINQNL